MGNTTSVVTSSCDTFTNSYWTRICLGLTKSRSFLMAMRRSFRSTTPPAPIAPTPSLACGVSGKRRASVAIAENRDG